jgi:hypothetical protein
MLYELRDVPPHLPVIEVLPTVMGNMGIVNVVTPKMRVNRASRILGVPSCTIDELCTDVYP